MPLKRQTKDEEIQKGAVENQEKICGKCKKITYHKARTCGESLEEEVVVVELTGEQREAMKMEEYLDDHDAQDQLAQESEYRDLRAFYEDRANREDSYVTSSPLSSHGRSSVTDSWDDGAQSAEEERGESDDDDDVSLHFSLPSRPHFLHDGCFRDPNHFHEQLCWL